MSEEINLRQRGGLVAALGSALFHGNAALGDVPLLLRRVLESGAWREYETETHQVVHYDRFEAFVTTPPTRGLGADLALIRRIVADDPAALDLLDRALQRPDGRPVETFDNVQDLPQAPTGNSSARALRALRDKRPDLHARVLAGELSPHAAMVEAGFRKPTVAIPVTDTMYDAARVLKRRLTPDQYNRLWEMLVQVESEDYIVDADE